MLSLRLILVNVVFSYITSLEVPIFISLKLEQSVEGLLSAIDVDIFFLVSFWLYLEGIPFCFAEALSGLLNLSQQTFTDSNLTIERLEQGVKYVQN